MLHREKNNLEGLNEFGHKKEITDLKFLLVDDSVTMRKIYANSLRSLGYQNFIEAVDGEDALKKLNPSANIDFIITDWNMHGISGAELVSLIRKNDNKKLKNLPIMIIGVRSFRHEITKALNNGANGYIIKPFTPTTLKEKIGEILVKISSEKVSESIIKNTFEVIKEIRPTDNSRSILDECH